MSINGESTSNLNTINFVKDIDVTKIENGQIPIEQSYDLPLQIESITQDKNILTVIAITKNATTIERKIISYPRYADKSPLSLSVNLKRKEITPSLPPQVPPMPVEWVFPAMSEIVFITTLNLNDYEYSSEVLVTVRLELRQERSQFETKNMTLSKY